MARLHSAHPAGLFGNRAFPDFGPAIERRSGYCPWPAAKGGDPLSQRIIEMLIGRLIADEQFRAEFLDDPEKTLLGLCERGLELSKTEIAALINTDPALWERMADAIDPRLQKVSLKNEVRVS
jgi:hypothetical protein